jgi:effector-binding domain-containing protein
MRHDVPMDYRIDLVDVEPTILASIRARVSWAELPATIMARLDTVYAFLKTAPVTQQGHNVCIYHGADQTGADLEAGVQVSARFDDTGGEVRCSGTPGGRAARTVHRGDYSELGQAADALIAWCREHVGVPSGPSWEVYGDWSDDPAQREVTVYRLLPPAGR